MRRILLLLATAVLLGGCASENPKIAPVNPDASPEARQLLDFLYSVRGKYTLTGQHNFKIGRAHV